MNGIFQPGTAILANLSFRGKFTLIGAAMIGVIAVLSAAIVYTMLTEIHAVQHEERGIDTISKVVPILAEVQKHRGLNSAYLGGDASALSKLQAINAHQDKLIATVDSDDNIRAFGVEKQWAAVKAAWLDIRDHSSSYSKPQSFAEHTKLVASMQTLVVDLADASGITLDPEMDSYYLQDTALLKLIALTESIGKLRAKGTGVLAAKTSTPEERAEIAILSGNIVSYDQAVRQNLVKATAQRPELRTELTASAEKISSLIAALQQTVKSDVLTEAPTLPPTSFFAQATSTIDAVLALYDQADQALDDILTAREKSLTQKMTLYLIGGAIPMLIAIYFFLAMSAGVSTAVHEIETVAEAFANGDLTRRIKLSSKDEMGRIASSFNGAGDKLRESMMNVERSAQSVFSSAAALQTSSQQIANASVQQSESIQSTAAAIEEITISITQVAENSREASSVATAGAKISEAGEKTVHQAAEEMNSIASSVSQSAALIDGLNERARQISSIVGVIRDIADQTNLLALNAAIEAARAGEQGRGFAVVADEVRKLAERTGNATGEITAMIGDIQRETANAVANMETGSSQAGRGVQLAEEAAASLAQVNTGSHDTRIRIEEIASAMREQSAATTNIAQNLERISQMSENSNQEVQNTIQSIAELERMATQLHKQVAAFKV
jgi:methyl-accepting chemotaxis protein